MNLRRPSVLIVVLFSLLAGSACETAAQRQAKEEMRRQAERPIVCRSESECEMMWGRAIAWIARNSKWKFDQRAERAQQ